MHATLDAHDCIGWQMAFVPFVVASRSSLQGSVGDAHALPHDMPSCREYGLLRELGRYYVD